MQVKGGTHKMFSISMRPQTFMLYHILCLIQDDAKKIKSKAYNIYLKTEKIIFLSIF